MIKTEICINCDKISEMSKAVKAAFSAGADTVELCSAMHLDGLTPKQEFIIEARKEFQNKTGLMVMIRPREGDFCYSKKELTEMKKLIISAAQLGANGVVFGVLNKTNNIDSDAMNSLIEVCRKFNLFTTFHRAFDTLVNPLESLELLVRLGVDRILTSGTKWGAGKTAIDGIDNLRQLTEAAKSRIEIVIAGGINSKNVKEILQKLPLNGNNISVHAYSGVQEDGITTFDAVSELIMKVKGF
jgi:copper homeostasis protein